MLRMEDVSLLKVYLQINKIKDETLKPKSGGCTDVNFYVSTETQSFHLALYEELTKNFYFTPTFKQNCNYHIERKTKFKSIYVSLLNAAVHRMIALNLIEKGRLAERNCGAVATSIIHIYCVLNVSFEKMVKNSV